MAVLLPKLKKHVRDQAAAASAAASSEEDSGRGRGAQG